MARGFVSNLQEDERVRESLRETIRTGRERGETLKEAFGAAWKGASEEWRTAEERRQAEEAAGERVENDRSTGSSGSGSSGRRFSPGSFMPRAYPLNVLSAYNRLGLEPGASLDEANRKRRELIKKYHPDRFTDPDKRRRAERLSADINAAHDTIERHLSKI